MSTQEVTQIYSHFLLREYLSLYLTLKPHPYAPLLLSPPCSPLIQIPETQTRFQIDPGRMWAGGEEGSLGPLRILWVHGEKKLQLLLSHVTKNLKSK